MLSIEETLSRTKKNYSSVIVGITIGLFFITVFNSLINDEVQTRKIIQHAETVHFADSLKVQIDQQLNEMLFISKGLASYLTVYRDDLKAEKVQDMLADYYQKTGHIKSISISEQYQIRYIYPLETYEHFIGVDFKQYSLHSPIIETAVAKRQGVLVGPMPLLQGGRGLVYRYPVFIQEAFWGILSTVIDTQSFLQFAFENTQDAPYVFALRMKGDAKQLPEHLYGDASLFSDKLAFVTELTLPNGVWQWVIVPKEDASQNIFWLAKGMALLVSVLLGFMAYYFMQHREELKRHALHDMLTGLPNRRLLSDRAQQAMLLAKRSGNFMAVMMIDIDHFKQYNDTFGHEFGDAVILKVANVLGTHLRATDTLSRLGGDEFVLIFAGLPEKKDVHIIAEKITRAFTGNSVVQNEEVAITLSIGVAIYSVDDHISFKHLLANADSALYTVKKGSRNGYQVFVA